MSIHRRHLITRKADGFFWCGLFGWQQDAADAQIFDLTGPRERTPIDLTGPDAPVFLRRQAD